MKRLGMILLIVLTMTMALQAEKMAVVTKMKGDVTLATDDLSEFITSVGVGTILEEQNRILAEQGDALRTERDLLRQQLESGTRARADGPTRARA